MQRCFERLVSMWFRILNLYFAYKGLDYACTGVMIYVKFFWVNTTNALGKLINTLFANVFIGTVSVIIMALYLDILNDKIHVLGMYALENGLNNEGTWYDGQKYGNSTITRVSGNTYAGVWIANEFTGAYNTYKKHRNSVNDNVYS